MQKIRWGLIGCGVIAPAHAGAVMRSECAELTAVADADATRGAARAEEYGVPFYSDYREMVRSGKVDAVSICTPSGLHAEMTIAASEAGVHVLCEKPMAITKQQMDAMMEACERAGTKLSVVFQRRTYAGARAAREAVRDGRLGRMVLGNAYLKYYRAPAYYGSAGWRATWELDGGGALMNQGIHGIDLLLWIMGDVESVYAKAEAKSHQIEVEDTCVALLTFANGAYGAIEGATSCNPGEPTSVQLYGDKGTIHLEENHISKWAVADSRDTRAENEPSLCRTSDPEDGLEPRGHSAHVNDLCEAIREDRDPAITPESARKSVELILAIYESQRTGREVSLSTS